MSKLPNKILGLDSINHLVKIPKYYYFNLKYFNKSKNEILNNIKKNFKKKIIVRSAHSDEDNTSTNAGKYLSISNISSKNFSLVEKSINKVFKSYGRVKKEEYVLIQEYIENAESVGVIFTADPRNGFPYRTVNFNDSSSTDIITSGKANGQILCYLKNTPSIKLNKKIKKLEKIVQKLEKKFPNIFLDIEFLILKKNIYILQVRKLKINHKNKINFTKSLNFLEKKISKMINEKSFLLGKQRYFSTMTDWNPAEIIGLKPKPLSLSLYQSLITDEIWANSRVELGYKDVKRLPLLYSFLGTPYIDIKTDINSFLIPNLSKNIQKKLINFYLSKFKKNPNFFYDKIESSLVVNSISLDTNKYKEILSSSNLAKKEIREIIKKYTELTSNIILQLKKNIKKYQFGENIFKKLKYSKNSTINKIYLLHNMCQNYGTLPFANLARMAFIAVEFLNSFKKLKIITDDEKELFLQTNKSISYEMKKDLLKSRNKFIQKYGHLRPNTYEISTPNYKDNFDNYFKELNIVLKKPKKFKFKTHHKNKINYLLKKNNFKKINADILINFIENAIYHRENSKLYFTKIIDEIFNQLKILAKRVNLSENKIQFLDIKKILSFYQDFSNEKIISHIKKNSFENKNIYDFNQNFNLPNIILNKKDIYFFEEKKASPTFITNKTIISKFITLKKISKKLNLHNKIVCIENADPGYDFIFNYKINGLITAFGGPNSHMSIRCNEFSLPAAIGIGEKKFQLLTKNNNLYLNCKKKILSGL